MAIDPNTLQGEQLLAQLLQGVVPPVQGVVASTEVEASGAKPAASAERRHGFGFAKKFVREKHVPNKEDPLHLKLRKWKP